MERPEWRKNESRGYVTGWHWKQWMVYRNSGTWVLTGGPYKAARRAFFDTRGQAMRQAEQWQAEHEASELKIVDLEEL
jgi:hypothetical protein